MSTGRKLAAALASVAASPILSHMRKVAYSPVKLSDDYEVPNTVAIQRAEEKRIRKQQKRIGK